jgi:hypothetical protein
MTSYPLARGPRVLPEVRFPWITTAVETIETFRAQYAYLEQQDDHDPETGLPRPEFHFQPVLSILGPRGSGKTSALLTLLARLRRAHPADLILDPLDPHRFLDDDRILYWFLAALGPYVRRIGEVERLKLTPRARGYDNRGSTELADDLHTNGIDALYHELSDKARWMFQAIGEAGIDTRLEQRFRQHYLTRSLDFSQRLDGLVRRLTTTVAVERRSVAAGQSANVGRELPLLILPLDDADLVPEYFDDLMTFLRIVSPWVSRLVTILTADEPLAMLTMTARYLRTMFAESRSQRHTIRSILDLDSVDRAAEQLARQSLTKLLPQSQRFFLEPLSVVERMRFRPVEADGVPDLTSLLDELGIGRFLHLDWAIRSSRRQPRGTIWSEYAAVVSNNPRALEQGYDVLRTASIGGGGRRRVFDALYRLFVATPYDEILRSLRHVLHMESVGENRLLVLNPGIHVKLEFHPTTPWSVVIAPANPEEHPSRVQAHGFFEAQIAVSALSDAGSVMQTDLPHMPNALVLSYLVLQELRRPGLAHFSVGADIPGFHLSQLAEVWVQVGIDTTRLANERPPTGFLRFPAPYPISVWISDSDLVCLPMPAWRFPIQWWIYFAYWNHVVTQVVNPTHTTKGGLIFLFFHLFRCATRIGRLDPMAIALPHDSVLDIDAPAPDRIADPLAELETAYRADIVEGDGVVADWVERALFRFLDCLETTGRRPFDDIGLNSEAILAKVIGLTVDRLSKDPAVGGRFGTLKNELPKLLRNSGAGSLVFDQFRKLRRLTGAQTTAVGLFDDVPVDGPNAVVGDLTPNTGRAGHIEPPADPA